MAVILKRSAILHIPKTGGKYVTDVLEANGISYDKTPNKPCTGMQNLINRGHSSHCLPFDEPVYQNTLNRRACFLRHPLTWYQSYWAYRVAATLPGLNPDLYWRIGEQFDGSAGCILDEATHADDFQDWIDNVIQFIDGTPELNRMGVCTLGFDVYIKECSFVGKMENLNEDLEKFLWMYEQEVIDTWPPRSNKGIIQFKERAKYRPDQIEKLMEQEQYFITAFDYGYIPEGIVENHSS